MNTLEALQALSDPELIEKVAKDVMGWFLVPTKDGEWWVSGSEHITEHSRVEWKPLTCWCDTMRVVERMQKQTWFYQIGNGVHSEPAYCRFWDRGRLKDVTAYGTPQRAIVLASLLAVSPA